MQGFININKPSGPSSHDLVYQVRRAVGRGVKVGHAGTLDPFAQGVLVVCVGGACRLVDLVMGQTKRYQAVIRLGAISDTDDRTGEVIATPDALPPAEAQVRQAVTQFVGEIQQVPPRHSAIYVEGRRAYKIARAGGELNLPARPVTVYRIDVLSYDWPDLTIDVTCGSGTYIRSLARDIGSVLGVGGYCRELTRTAVGEFTIQTATDVTALDPQRHLVPALTAVAHMPQATLMADDLPHLLKGRRIAVPPERWSTGVLPPVRAEVAILSPKGQVMALGYLTEDHRVQPTKVIVDVKHWSE